MTTSRKEQYGITNGFNLTYKKRLVAFIDILGFSKLVLSRTNDDDVDFIANLIPDALRTHVGNSLREDLEITNISDSVILSLETSANDTDLNTLLHLSIIIGRLQHELALQGFYIRGAITVGDFYHNSSRNIIIGPPFIRAYQLETQQAIVPRVILDSEINNFYGLCNDEIMKISNSEFTNYYYKSNIIKSTDSNSKLDLNEYKLFIDYVSPIYGRYKKGFKDSQFKYLDTLLGLLKSGVEEKKYQWLGNYTLDVYNPHITSLDEKTIIYLKQLQAQLS